MELQTNNDSKHWQFSTQHFNKTHGQKRKKIESDDLASLMPILRSNFPENMVLGEHDNHVAHEIVNSMNEPYREYLLYHEVLEFSYEEIAEQFGVDLETATRKVR